MYAYGFHLNFLQSLLMHVHMTFRIQDCEEQVWCILILKNDKNKKDDQGLLHKPFYLILNQFILKKIKYSWDSVWMKTM